jgi:hypothetical protein
MRHDLGILPQFEKEFWILPLLRFSLSTIHCKKSLILLKPHCYHTDARRFPV